MEYGKVTILKNDPFARMSIVRCLIPTEDRGYCMWCGEPARFAYGTWQDGLNTKPEFSDYQFCSKNCHNAYYF